MKQLNLFQLAQGMKQESPASGNREVQHYVERGLKTTKLKGKSQVPCCRSLTQITKQLAFELYEPTCGNSKQPPNSGASSEIKP